MRETMMKIDPLWQPAIQQQVFRHVLDAFSRPGTIIDLSDLIGTHTADMAVLAALLDRQVSLADPANLLDERLWALMQAQQVSCDVAQFILAEGAVHPEFEPHLGTLESPESGATVVVRVKHLEDNGDIELRGPGIEKSHRIQAIGLATEWIKQREQWVYAFPMGVDMVLTDATSLLVIPRSTRIKMHGVIA
jgi:alpha-D-ribose 1-methylphosphonate 5-triphosphate synthase subunit PhnH